MSTLNLPLLTEAMNAIANEPSRWNQKSWVDSDSEPCKTTMCLAGHTAIQSGEYALGQHVETHSYWDTYEERVVTNVTKTTDFFNKARGKFLNDINADGNEHVAIADEAARMLGIDQNTAHRLFHYTDGTYVRNPDAFRIFVVKTLLEAGYSEAVQLLDLTGGYDTVVLPEPEPARPLANEDLIESCVLWGRNDEATMAAVRKEQKITAVKELRVNSPYSPSLYEAKIAAERLIAEQNPPF